MSIAFDHVARVVPDIAEAVEFYRALIPGARVLHQDSTWAFVDVAGVKLAFVVRDLHPDHLAWRVSAEALEAMSVRFGKEIRGHRDGTRSFYLEGPGGQSIEIITFEGSDWERTGGDQAAE